MKKLIIFFAVIFLLINRASAQSDYVVHIITAGETLSQLADEFGTTVGDIMRLNGMDTYSKLYVGETVKIPTPGAEATEPATHVVARGETLYQISRKYRVTVSQLREWNNMPDNTIKVGQVLYLSAPADNQQASNAASNDATPAVNQDTVLQGEEVLPPSNTVQQTTVQSTPAVDADPYAAAYQGEATNNSVEAHTEGISGIFKSDRGWNDQNYFVLMNDIAPGKMVKIQANGKTIYAKVLWNLGNIKENDGLSYRISDAAAAALNLSGDSFDIVISYFK